MIVKRLFDVVMSLVGLLVTLPLLMLIALLIKWETPGPAMFRQERVGRYGEVFRVHKFRTMVLGAEKRGTQVTVAGDSRVTRFGAFLRAYKLDELPQLLDVLIGRMSLVGPRPEVPKYVSFYPEEVRAVVLSVRPGITDWASIRFRNENDLLRGSANPEKTYIEQILPSKQRLYVEYVKNRTFFGDVKIIAITLAESWCPRRLR